MAIPGIVKDNAIGALKGVAQTGYNLADMTQRAATFGIGPHLPPNPINTQPTNTPQAVGKGAEQVAEYFAPGSAIEEGVNAVRGATAGVRGAGMLQGAARAGMEAIGAGGVNFAQTEDPKQAAKAALTAGGTSAATSAIGAAIPSAQRVYQSALKPTGQLAKREAAVQTGINEGIIPGEAGRDRVQGLLKQLHDEVLQKTAGRDVADIQPGAVASRIDELKQGPFGKQATPASDLASINNVKAEYLAKHTPTGEPPPQPSGLLGPDGNPISSAPAPPPPPPSPMTASKAQEENTATYTMLRKKYGQLGSAEVEANKAIARGLKEELVARIPELAQTKGRESSLIELDKQLENFVRREKNKDLIGLKSTLLGAAVGGAGGYATTRSKEGAGVGLGGGVTASILATALGKPAIRAALAIAIDRAGGAAGNVARAVPKIAAGVQSQSPGMAKGGVVAPKGMKWQRKVKKMAKGGIVAPQTDPQQPQQPAMPTPSGLTPQQYGQALGAFIKTVMPVAQQSQAQPQTQPAMPPPTNPALAIPTNPSTSPQWGLRPRASGYKKLPPPRPPSIVIPN